MPAAADLRTRVESLSTIIHVSDETDGAVRIDLIAVPAELRGRGCATDALSQITSWADETGTELVLDATYALGSNIPRLIALYTRHGFTVHGAPTTGDVPMRRLPTTKDPHAQ